MNRAPLVGQGGAFALLIVGTAGLLLNEFVFDWGRQATLVFALASAIGLVVLVVTYLQDRARGS